MNHMGRKFTVILKSRLHTSKQTKISVRVHFKHLFFFPFSHPVSILMLSVYEGQVFATNSYLSQQVFFFFFNMQEITRILLRQIDININTPQLLGI